MGEGYHRIGIINVHDTSSNGDRPISQCHKPMSKEKNVTGLSGRHVKNAIIFHLKVKGQHRIGIMNVCNTLSQGATTICQIHGKPMSEQNK